MNLLVGTCRLSSPFDKKFIIEKIDENPSSFKPKAKYYYSNPSHNHCA